ncbi:MAG: hypothetical protein KKD17_02065 [Nanoarchaeota archaeon]|nr:hypothetical protein [Nanoarchaeota archaeon]
MQNLLFWAVIGVVSIVLILKSASYAVESIIRYAQRTHLTHYFVGLFIVSIGTSLPELFTAVISSLQNKTALVIGDAMGATIVDTTLVLAMVLVITGSFKVAKKEVSISWWKVFLVVFLPLVLALDGSLSRLDGVVFIVAFLSYFGVSIYKEVRKQKISRIPYTFALKETIIFGVNIAILCLGTQLLVFSSSNIADMLHIPMYLFGALFLSICTTSPEFVVELKAIYSKSAPLAIGDIFGSIICNNSLVLGVAVLISPVTLSRMQFYSVGIFMLSGVLLSLFFMRKGIMKRWQGIVLFSVYALFVAYQLYSLMR